MLSPWLVVAVSALTLLALFLIAHAGDRHAARLAQSRWKPHVYALSLAVYCTSWAFYGAVGQSASTGWGFAPTYLGTILLFVFGWRFLDKLIRTARAHHITSIADFIAARYGKSPQLAVLVTLMALIGIIPYIALQLKAVMESFQFVTGWTALSDWFDGALAIALLMALFAILFGTRAVDSAEHHPGLILAVAFEALIKLFAFVAIGVFVLGNFSASLAAPITLPPTQGSGADFLVQTLLGLLATFCLPRQFHVTVVEHTGARDLPTARWLFTLYLILMGAFIWPIAQAGLQHLPAATLPDHFVLALPQQQGNSLLTLIGFTGGLAAATSMVIVACVALSTMVSNDIVVPALLRFTRGRSTDFTGRILWSRRLAIVLLLLAAWAYYRMVVVETALASIGLVAFVAVAQFAPAMIAGLYWRTASQRGALAGLLCGFVVWAYTLLVPNMIGAGWLPPDWLDNGPLAISWLRPQALFGLTDLDIITHGTLMSLCANMGVLIAVSLASTPSLLERVQAKRFVEERAPLLSDSVDAGSLPLLTLENLCARFLGAARARQLFASELQRRQTSDAHAAQTDAIWIAYTQKLLAGAIGAASARVVLTAALRRHDLRNEDVIRLVDEASAVFQFNQEVLGATLASLQQGVCVVDRELNIIAWNQAYIDLFGYPPGLIHVGRPIADVIRWNAERECAAADIDQFVQKRLLHLQLGQPHHAERARPDGRTLEIHGLPMPGGGYVTSYSDISEHKRIARALRDSNEQLETRVQARTAELEQARHAAEEANAGKTRFLAAASHDLLQPLHAAQLFLGALDEKISDPQARPLLASLHQSLQHTDELLKTLLDISKLDAGVLQAQRRVFSLTTLLTHITASMQAFADEKNLQLRLRTGSFWVHSDERMLRRILQNLISNALRYTLRGGVLISARRRGEYIEIAIHDTGIGIAADQQSRIFEEFQRLPSAQQQATPGHGLGLAIVQRMSRALQHPLTLHSTPGRGSVFRLRVPRAEAEALEFPAPELQRSQHPLQGLRVLCLDNDNAVLRGMENLLQGWGCYTVTVSNGAQAHDAANRERFDLLIADFHLDHGETGLGVWQHLRAETGLPVLIVSADRSDAMREQIQQAGGQFLPKPVKPLALRNVLAQMRAQWVTGS